MTDHKWEAGQKAAIGTEIVTIERVTATGRAVVGGRTFRFDGSEISKRRYHRAYLRPLTPDVAEEIELKKQTESVRERLYTAVTKVERWHRNNFPAYYKDIVATREQISAANRLAEAIENAMKDVTP